MENKNLNALFSEELYAVLKSDTKNKNGIKYKVDIEKEKIIFTYLSSFLPATFSMQFGALGALIQNFVTKKWGKEVRLQFPLSSIKKVDLYRKKVMFKQIQFLKFWDVDPASANDKNIALSLTVDDEQLAKVKVALQGVLSKVPYNEVQG